MSDKITSLVEKEFVFNQLIQNKTAIDFIINNKSKFTGFINSFSKSQLTIKHNSNLPLTPYQKLTCSFFFRDNRHTFNTIVVSIIDTKTFIIKEPKEILRNLQRRFERVKIEDIQHIQISYKGKVIDLNFPKTEVFSPFPEKDYLSKSNNSIKNLLAAFKNKMSIFSENHIYMLRGKSPSTLEEFLIIKTGKSFYIPNTFRYFPDSSVYDSSKVIVVDDIVEYEKLMGTAEIVIPDKINSLLISKQKKNIFSELYYPVIYKNYVISYIYIMNTIDKKAQIAFNTIYKLDEFSKLLIAGLIKSNYFESLEIDKKQTNLVDISAGGVLISSNDKMMWDSLDKGTRIKISFSLKEHLFDLKGMVRRKFEKDDNFYFGVQFIDIPLDTINLLKELLYTET